jgi:hypothetical protein
LLSFFESNKNSSAIYLSFEKDKNGLQNTIAPGKSGILLFK